MTQKLYGRRCSEVEVLNDTAAAAAAADTYALQSGRGTRKFKKVENKSFIVNS